MVTIEEKKQELRRYRLLLKRIERKEQERRRWLELGTTITPIYSDMPKAQNTSNKVEQAGIACAQIAEELSQDICELTKEKRHIERAIRSVEDKKLRLILEKHYIDGLTFDRLEEDLGIDRRWILRLYKKALNNMTIEDH